MTGVGAAYIRKQPFDIRNSFGLMGNENLVRVWEYREETCSCSGSYYTTLTDTRLLLRSEDTKCCTCCSEPKHADASIFLRDIAEIRESRDSQNCCVRCCPTCCCACCNSCCNIAQYLEVRGTFGKEILHLSKQDMPRVQIEIPAAIGNHKLVSQY